MVFFMARRSLRFNNSFLFRFFSESFISHYVTSVKTGEIKLRLIFKDEHGNTVSYLFDELFLFSTSLEVILNNFSLIKF